MEGHWRRKKKKKKKKKKKRNVSDQKLHLYTPVIIVKI
jgi:hypothetical protein